MDSQLTESVSDSYLGATAEAKGSPVVAFLFCGKLACSTPHHPTEQKGIELQRVDQHIGAEIQAW